MKYLSNSEKKEINPSLPKGYIIEKKDEIKINDQIVFKNNIPFMLQLDGKFFPHLKSIPEKEYACVYIDHGAIPFIAKGADLMRPGIRKIDPNIKPGDIIQIKDEIKQKTIALGISILSSEELESQEKGKSIKVFHFVGDKYYSPN